MARLPRIHLDGMIYYVSSKAASDAVIRDQQDYETYLTLVSEYKQRYGFQLFAYCLAPDQVHLCLEPAAGTTISEIMHDLATRYTKYYNKRYNRSGPLFQERFKAVLVEKEHSLLFVTACLHRWPSQSGLTSDFTAYPFSSYPRYMGTAGPCAIEMSGEIAEILKLLPGERTAEAYQQYVAGLSPAETQRPHRQRILGSEAFIQRVKERLNGSIRPQPQPCPVDEPADPAVLRRQGMLMTAGSLAAALLGFGVIIASLYHRVGVVEDGIVVLSQENEASFLSSHSPTTVQQAKAEAFQTLESGAWAIRLMPVNGADGHAMQQDELMFAKQQISSKALAGEGFSGGRYIVTAQPGRVALWEAVQSNAKGEVITWKGEWEGTIMRGIMTRQATGSSPEQFTFVGAADAAHPRSET